MTPRTTHTIAMSTSKSVRALTISENPWSAGEVVFSLRFYWWAKWIPTFRARIRAKVWERLNKIKPMGVRVVVV